MKKSIWFYRDVLGFTVFQQSKPGDDFDWAWLKKDDTELMLNTMYESDRKPASPDPARTDAHRDTAVFFGCRELDAAYEHLHSHGIELKKPVVAPYGMKQLWLKDPDGYTICFQWNAEHAL